MPDEVVEVLLVHDRTVVRAGLRALIESEPGLAVVGEAGTLGDAGQLAVSPDVIVAEIELPDAKGADVVQGLHDCFPESPVLVLTLAGHPSKVRALLAAGAAGYVLLTADPDELFNGIVAVAGGEAYLQPALGVELARWLQPPASALALTPREEEVLELLAAGHTNVEIAQALRVGVRTIETHRGRIYQKLGARTRAELVQRARELGLSSTDEH